MIHEAYEPDVIVGLFDADGLSGKDLAEVDLLPVEADASACCDGDSPVMERVFDIAQALILAR